LKFLSYFIHSIFSYVALFTGAWIEILHNYNYHYQLFVALFTGAWIEMDNVLIMDDLADESRSLRARGLK